MVSFVELFTPYDEIFQRYQSRQSRWLTPPAVPLLEVIKILIRIRVIHVLITLYKFFILNCSHLKQLEPSLFYCHLLFSLKLIFFTFQLPLWFEGFRYFSLFLAYCNSAINPILYGGFNNNFRQGLCNVLRCVYAAPLRRPRKLTINVNIDK